MHFPIALLPAAAVCDLMALLSERQRCWLERAAVSLHLAAALGAGAAFWAGKLAVEGLPALPPSVQAHVNQHSDSALYTLWLIVLVAVARSGLQVFDSQAARKVPRLAVLLAALAAMVSTLRTADLGGALVYRHGVGVSTTTAPARRATGSGTAALSPRAAGSADSLDGPAESRVHVDSDGALEWVPLPTDEAALGTVLTPMPGTSTEAVAWLPPSDDRVGLRLAVAGEALLVLPGTFGDVLLEAHLDLSDFDGEVGLVHHVQSARRGAFFTVVDGQEYSLGQMDGDEVERLSAARGVAPSGPVRLTVSAVGRHLRGLVDDETVVHGHAPALPPGRVGLLFAGRGSVEILAMRVVPGE